MHLSEQMFEEKLGATIAIIVILGLIGLSVQVFLLINRDKSQTGISTGKRVPRIDDFMYIDK